MWSEGERVGVGWMAAELRGRRMGVGKGGEREIKEFGGWRRMMGTGELGKGLNVEGGKKKGRESG